MEHRKTIKHLLETPDADVRTYLLALSAEERKQVGNELHKAQAEVGPPVQKLVGNLNKNALTMEQLLNKTRKEAETLTTALFRAE